MYRLSETEAYQTYGTQVGTEKDFAAVFNYVGATPAGKAFSGWMVGETGAVYQPGDMYKFGEDANMWVDGKVTFIAQYGNEAVGPAANTFTVTFVNGEAQYNVTVVEGQAVAQPFDPAAPAGQTFAGWYVQGTETLYTFTDPVTADGLVLVATFVDDGTVEPEYSEDVVVGFLKGADGLTVTFTAKDGKEIPAGDLTITYWYLAYNEDLGRIAPTPGTYTYEGGIAAGTAFVDIPAGDIVGYENAYEMTITYQIEGQDADVNSASFTPVIPEVPTA